MHDMKTKTVMKGVTLQKWPSGKKTLRFSAMIDGKRFTKTCDIAADLLVDPRTGRPSSQLRAEYNAWIDRCSGEAGVEQHGLIIPTCKELLDMYEKIAWERHHDPNHRKPCERAINAALLNFRHCMVEAGIKEDEPYTRIMDTKVIRQVFESFSKRMTGTSAYSYIMGLKSVTARWAIIKYLDMGFKVEAPLLPDVGNAKKPPEYKMLTPSQRAKIEKWYIELAGHEDREAFMAASIVAQLAVRPSDVALLTSDNFVRYPDDRRVHLVYRPHKTVQSSNRRVDWPISDHLWELICSVAGERLKEGRTILKTPRRVFDFLNASMREACDMEDWTKAVYELRKLCIDTVRREQGVDAAVALSGDRRETIDRYYSDPYKLIGITPIEILPMPAIAAKKI